METEVSYSFIERLQKISYPEGTDLREQLYHYISQRDYRYLMKENPLFAREILGQKSDLTEAELTKRIEDYILQQKEFIYSVPTKFENAYQYSIILDLAQDVENALQDLNYNFNTKVILGTLPSGSIDGQTLADPYTGNIIIIIESGVFSFADLFSKVIASCLVTESPSENDSNISWMGEDYKNNITNNPNIITEFEDVLEACVFYGTPSAPPDRQKILKKAFLLGLYGKTDTSELKESLEFSNSKFIVRSQHVNNIASILRQAIETFIIAHEYAHIVLGHVKTEDTRPHFLLDTNQSYDVLRREWLEEYEADKFALNILFHIFMKQGINPILAFWGIEAFFSLIETIDKGICFFTQLEYKNFYPPTISHPLPQLRIGLLHHILNKKRIDNDFHPALDQTLIGDIVEELWNKFIMNSGIFGISTERKISSRWASKLKGDHHMKRETIGFKPFIIDEWLEKNKR